MRVERARTDDAAAVHALVEEAAQHLTRRGIRQWLPGALPLSVVERGIASGEVFVVRDGERLAASVTLQDEDSEIWGERSDSALYLHRLVVSRAERGTGLGRRLLDWACERARELGRASLRLDCVASNEFLRRYYADAGFVERGEVDLGRVRLALFERAVTSDLPARKSAPPRSR